MSEKHKQCEFSDGNARTVAWIPAWAAVEGNHVQLKSTDEPEKFWKVIKVSDTELDSEALAIQSRVYKNFSMTSLLKSRGGID